jgi:hypothetical protein
MSKGQIQATAMIIIGAAITIFIGIWVISSVITSTGTPLTYGYVTNVANTSIITTSTNFLLPAASTYSHSFALSNTTIVIVNTSGTVLTTTNYTAYSNGTVSFNTWNSGATGGGLNFSYEYGYVPDATYSAIDSATNTTWNAVSLLSVALIIICAVAILGYFGMKVG